MKFLEGKTTIIAFIISIIFIYSCSDDSNSENNQNDDDIQGIVINQDTSSGDSVDYTYDSLGRILTWNGIQDNSTYEYTYTYDSNGNPISREMVISDPNPNTFIETFIYDNQNRLIQFNDFFFLDYISDNQAELTTSNGGNSIFDINDNGRVTKISDQFGFETFQYDSNGNLIRVEYFDELGVMYDGYTIIFDQQPNPFYGQLAQLHILYINRFSNLTQLPFDFRGYDYPYFVNNVTQVRQDGASDFNTINYEYDYNTFNYPTQAAITHGNSEFVYSINYND